MMDILAEGFDEDIIAWKDQLSPTVMLPISQVNYTLYMMLHVHDTNTVHYIIIMGISRPA